MYGFDKSGRIRIIVESLTNLTDGDLKNRVGDKGSRPHRMEQFFLCGKLARPSNQIVEHGKSLRPEFNGLGASQQALVGLVQAKRMEECLMFKPHFSSQTLRKVSSRVMTYILRTDYCLLSMKEWQYKAAFVIQIQADCSLDNGQIKGRVEHVASTLATRFHSVDELLVFISTVLAEVRKTEQH